MFALAAEGQEEYFTTVTTAEAQTILDRAVAHECDLFYNEETHTYHFYDLYGGIWTLQNVGFAEDEPLTLFDQEVA